MVSDATFYLRIACIIAHTNHASRMVYRVITLTSQFLSANLTGWRLMYTSIDFHIVLFNLQAIFQVIVWFSCIIQYFPYFVNPP